MHKLVLIFGFILCFHCQSFAQANSILGFFDNIFNISGMIEAENKERLQRELKYFAQKTDNLIELKKQTTKGILAHCAGNKSSEADVNSKIRQFNQKINQAVDNLESIRENVIFESDYDIVVDTIFEPTEVDPNTLFELEPGCYLKEDTKYITEEFAPEGFNPASQMALPVSRVVTDSVVVTNMYCPTTRESKRSKFAWKEISFSEMVDGFKFSLGTKSRNVDFLFQNCDRKLIVEERKVAIKALQEMRDKALDLKKKISTD